MSKTLLSLALMLCLSACAVAPPVVVPTEVLVPVYSCPVPKMPDAPTIEPLAADADDSETMRVAFIRIEQWRAYAQQLEAILHTFATKPVVASPAASAPAVTK